MQEQVAGLGARAKFAACTNLAAVATHLVSYCNVLSLIILLGSTAVWSSRYCIATSVHILLWCFGALL